MPLLTYKHDIISYVERMMNQYGEDQIFSLAPIAERLQFLCERLEEIHKEQPIESLQAMDGGKYLVINDNDNADNVISYFPKHARNNTDIQEYENFSWILEASHYQRGQRQIEIKTERFFEITIAELGRHTYALDICLYVNETSVTDFLATIISEVVKQYPNTELFCVEDRLFGALYTTRPKVAQELSQDSNQSENSDNSQDEKQTQPETTHESEEVKSIFPSDSKQFDFKNRYHLSDREWEVFVLWGQGFSQKSIAEKLCLGVSTIVSHKQNAAKKIECELPSLRDKYLNLIYDECTPI